MDPMALARIQVSAVAGTPCACNRLRQFFTAQAVRDCPLRRGTRGTRTGRRPGQDRRRLVAYSYHGGDGDVEVPSTYSGKDKDNKTVLFKYVSDVEPSVVESFERTGPPQVVEAMKATSSSLTGSLPFQFFEVNIVTLGDNLKSLMFSFVMTGYLYRNVVDHLELKRGLERALPDSVLQDDLEQDITPGMRYGLRSENLDGYAQTTKKVNVSGTVKRWHYQTGHEDIEAKQYIEMLEKEVELLREQIIEDDSMQEDSRDQNELLQHLHGAPTSIHQLRPGKEVSEAVDMFLCRLLGTDDARELSSMVSETTAPELQRLLSWLMIVGYTLRSMEIRFSMEQSYALPFVALEDKGIRDNL